MKYVWSMICVLMMAVTALAADWPNWRGPNHNGISQETGWLDRWPEQGPPIAWQAEVGVGFSAVSVSGGRLFTMGHGDGQDTVYCFDAVSGKPIWSHSYQAALGDVLFEGGPTATPAVDGDRVYTLSRWGDVYCFETGTGKVLWSKNIAKEVEAEQPAWGFSGSPLVHGDVLVLTIGGAGTALNKKTGETVWQSDRAAAGYSTPLPFQRGGAWYVLVSSGRAYTAVNPRDGKELWSQRWLTQYGVNAADPIVNGNEVFLSTGYNKGAVLLDTTDPKPTVLWQNRNMRNQMNSSILIDGHIYGIDGDQHLKAELRCLDWKTGDKRWSFPDSGCGSLMAADGKLIVLSDQGELFIAPAAPDSFEPTARAQVLRGKCWTVPVLANGFIYCRDAKGKLVAVDVRKK
ncbi:MAG: PQQ-binding-like beta-propeller repeat protein [Gemmataceae bacterium]